MPSAVVIGAGPAGATTALLLSRGGWHVTLVEQSRFPRNKVCGECLSSLGIATLTRLGLAERIRAHGPVTLRHSNLYGPSGEVARVTLDHPMWGIRRRDLDTELLRASREAGAEVLQPARVESIEPGAQPVVRLRDLTSNCVTDLTCDTVFLADGKAALLDGRPELTGDLGIKAHFRNATAPQETIGLYSLRGHYVGLAPVNGDLWNLAFSAPASRVKDAGSLDQLLEWAMSENKALRAHLSATERVSDWLASPLPRYPVVSAWPDGVVPVGNAAAALEPIGGEGMGLAIASAVAAVEQASSPQSLARKYRGLWTLRRGACRVVAAAVSRPALAGPVVELAAANESLTRGVMSLMGK